MKPSEGLEDALQRAQRLGFLGNGSVDDQIRHSLGFAAALGAAGLREPRGFLDLGSGGGIPGLVLADHWPQVPAVLLDANQRRCEALDRAVISCGWQSRVQVVRDRAERAGRLPALRGAFEVVVARSFGAPAVVAECSAPFLAVGGLLVISEPPPEDGQSSMDVARSETTATEPGSSPSRWPAEALAALGLSPALSFRHGAGYQVLRQDTPCPDRFPRREGVPAKRPLYR